MMISTSILDCEDRVMSVLQLNNTNTSYIHVDVMDGKFVPSVQFQDIEEIKNIQKICEHPLDVHLMMEAPLSYIEKLENMNIGFITIHLEINKNINEIIRKIHEFGYKVGLSLKPNTDLKDIEKYLEEIDMVLLMSVEPGMGGQKFMESTIVRIQELKKLIHKANRNILIEVDGGINDITIRNLKNVDIAVVGSYIVKSDDYNMQIENLRNINFGKNLKLVTYEIFSIFLFFCGIFIFFLWEYLSSNITLFLMSSFCIVMGIVLFLLDSKNFEFANDEKKLFRRKLFYKFLFWIGLLPFVYVIVFSLVCCFSEMYHGKLFVLLVVYYESLLHYFPLYLMFLGFILISVRNLSEIKLIVDDNKDKILEKK